jgi:hypothetical protein
MLQEAWAAHEPAAEEQYSPCTIRARRKSSAANEYREVELGTNNTKNVSAFRPLLNRDKQNTQAMHH